MTDFIKKWRNRKFMHIMQSMDLRESQRAWLKDMLRRSGTSATHVARKAGLASSTLTRFLNSDEANNALSSRTIASIEQVLREFSHNTVPHKAFKPQPPMLKKETGFSEGDSDAYIPSHNDPLKAAIEAFIDERDSVDPWVIKTRILEMIGFLPGDIAFVDLNGVPHAGDVVYAQVYDWRTMTAETIVRIFEPPFLVSASLDVKSRKPTLVDSDNVVIKGVVIGMIRPRMVR
jgi:lambda repressor-like predicted transcriptional regulator